MRRYNILNNSLGWFCFVVAAVTYLLTLEPTASFWDCPEFITQGFKLEVGHPPGNPIFMLTARFFANFAMGDVSRIAWWVNAMSGLLSAATILLLFWTITHLVKRLIVKDEAQEITPLKMVVIFFSGICGALMYAWSDTFWFSAVEGEVYAFSSFCTALVFWLILKWENRADRPDSDKYLILIAYVIGISIAVHLLNLLCIPAIVLIIYFKRSGHVNTKGSLLALGVSFVIVAFILYGLVPGLITVAQKFELFCVNSLGMPFNGGVLVYGIVTVASFVWTLYNVYHSSKVNPVLIKISFLLSLVLSGILLLGGSTLLFVLLTIAVIIYLWKARRLSMRMLGLVTMSIFVMFIGYSSYALLLIRSSAHTPMNQNAPDNVFALSSYLNREQYGDRPLVYGETLNFDFTPDGRLQAQNPVIRIYDPATGSVEPKQVDIRDEYAREIKSDPSQPDRYHLTGTRKDYVSASQGKMIFPRMYSTAHVNSYASWLMGDLEGKPVDLPLYQLADGTTYRDIPMQKATLAENLRFFFVYQLNHMYWRYFMWNFAGRQNDIQGQGEPTHGNWISGIPALDNLRLGDQSLLPDDLGKGNKGHNVFFMLPLIMGIIGLLWQAARGQRGIEQFWVVFFLFFMTGIAIILYLNQTPDQPRERDYSFAGSFYAFAIWVGMGVAGLWHYIRALLRAIADKKSKDTPDEDDDDPAEAPLRRRSMIAAVIAAIAGIIVPLQVVSQTWDDHDRSGRYTARDYGMNYLNSLDENAIIFTYGDNDTFPLWYAQEVEGVRTDVKVVNLSYLTTDWYINQIRRQSYDAPGVEISAPQSLYAYDANQFFSLKHTSDSLVDASTALEATYRLDQFDNKTYFAPKFVYPRIAIPANADAAIKAGRVNPSDSVRDIYLDLRQSGGGLGINSLMVIDILNNAAKNGWNRPVYFATTVPSDQYIGLEPYFAQTGMAYEILPADYTASGGINLDKMYRNVTEKWRWGGLDAVKAPEDIYLDETVRRMVASHRQAVLDLAMAFASKALEARVNPDVDSSAALDDYVAKADTLIALQEVNLPTAVVDYGMLEVLQLAELYIRLYQATGDQKYVDRGLALTKQNLIRFAGYLKYYQSLSPTLRSTLSNADRIVEVYYRSLLHDYHDLGGDLDEIIDIVSGDMGVDLRSYIQN